MADETTGQAARMELEPDAFHDGEEGYYIDCPECGSPAYIDTVIQEGRCQGYLGDAAASENVDHEPSCTAELTLELVWQS